MKVLLYPAVACLWSICAVAAEDTLSLAGSWRCALDDGDRGVAEAWYAKDLDRRLNLPGSLQEQGFGELPTTETRWMGDLNDRTFFRDPRYEPYRQTGNFKFPYWLTPKRYYSGAAWYQREVAIPVTWAGRRILLHLERPHWETTVWVDHQRIGSNNSLAAPHEYDLSNVLTPGRHRLTVRVDNRYVVPVGVNSHSVSDHTQGNWNGIVGRLELRATNPVWIERVQVYPDPQARKARLRVAIGNRTGEPGSGTIEVRSSKGTAPGFRVAPRIVPVQWSREGGVTEFDCDLGPNAPAWDEFNPALCALRFDLRRAGDGERAAPLDRRQVRFGLRAVSTRGTQITVNDRAVFLRGTLECCIFPLTGYPPTDVAGWKRVLHSARAHGLNHLRFHSWTPPEAAFEAADELGFYLYVECPTWANGDTSVGDGRPVDRWIYEEGDRILDAYGNHPSFLLMSYGNEPGGKNQNRWLGDLVRHWQARDPRRLYTSGAGWPMIPENDFHITPNARAYPVHARGGETAGDYRAFLAQQIRPILSHEIGQYCVFPNLDEIPKYRGWLEARNSEIVRDFLEQRGMLGQARDFLHASGRLQTLFYKDEIEACLRTHGWAGFQLLDLHDFPGQGTALVGVLDPFWEEKGYVKPAEYRRFCNDTVPLARLGKRVWTSAETLQADLEVAHFGHRDLDATLAVWRLRDRAGRVVAHGEFDPRTLPTGQVTPLGQVQVPLDRFREATALNLEVALPRTPFANDWNVWVYPGDSAVSQPAGVTLATQLDERAVAALEAGGRVVLLPEPRTLRGRTVGRFDPIFWNRMWFPTQPQHTLGLLMDPRHPALAAFPTAGHSDWQWQDLQNRSQPMVLDLLPNEFRPIVQVIDDWNTCRKLGLVFEASVGQGRLLVCSIDLEKDLEARPAARQLRRSLVEYAAGDRFQPPTRLSLDQLKTLFREPTAMERLGVRVNRTSSAQPGYEAALVLDGDPGTLWHTQWGDQAPGFPHELVVGWDAPATLTGLRLLPRQDGNRNGWIKDYLVFTSQDGTDWGEPKARGAFEATDAEKTIRFPQPVSARYLKLVAVSSFDPSQPFASLAELTLLVAEAGSGR